MHRQQKIREAFEEEKQIGRKHFNAAEGGSTATMYALPEKLDRFEKNFKMFTSASRK